MNLLMNTLTKFMKFLILPVSKLLNYTWAGSVKVVDKTLHIKASE